MGEIIDIAQARHDKEINQAVSDLFSGKIAPEEYYEKVHNGHRGCDMCSIRRASKREQHGF